MDDDWRIIAGIIGVALLIGLVGHISNKAKRYRAKQNLRRRLTSIVQINELADYPDGSIERELYLDLKRDMEELERQRREQERRDNPDY